MLGWILTFGEHPGSLVVETLTHLLITGDIWWSAHRAELRMESKHTYETTKVPISSNFHAFQSTNLHQSSDLRYSDRHEASYVSTACLLGFSGLCHRPPATSSCPFTGMFVEIGYVWTLETTGTRHKHPRGYLYMQSRNIWQNLGEASWKLISSN